MDPQELFLNNLDAIDRAVAFVCHRNHVRAQDVEEFGSEVKTRLIEGNYAVIRKFEGRSSFSTYMTTVIYRMYFQWRVQMWGKWRPSAQAKRLGEKAIALERLLTRDGYSYHEATQTLITGSPDMYTAAELEALYLRLPRRQPRPMLVPSVSPEIMPVVDGERALFSNERGELARVMAEVVDATIAAMDPESQLILRLRFWHNRTVPEISRAVTGDGRRLYRRIDRLLQALRTGLEKAGIAKEEVAELLDRPDHQLSFSSGNRRKTEFRHSQAVDGGSGAGRNRANR